MHTDIYKIQISSDKQHKAYPLLSHTTLLSTTVSVFSHDFPITEIIESFTFEALWRDTIQESTFY